jgi:hypothetical protein
MTLLLDFDWMFYFNNKCFILPYYQFDSQTGLLMFSLGECCGPTTYCLPVRYFSLNIGDNVSFKFGGMGFTILRKYVLFLFCY